MTPLVGSQTADICKNIKHLAGLCRVPEMNVDFEVKVIIRSPCN